MEVLGITKVGIFHSRANRVDSLEFIAGGGRGSVETLPIGGKPGAMIIDYNSILRRLICPSRVSVPEIPKSLNPG